MAEPCRAVISVIMSTFCMWYMARNPRRIALGGNRRACGLMAGNKRGKMGPRRKRPHQREAGARGGLSSGKRRNGGTSARYLLMLLLSLYLLALSNKLYYQVLAGGAGCEALGISRKASSSGVIGIIGGKLVAFRCGKRLLSSCCIARSIRRWHFLT